MGSSLKRLTTLGPIGEAETEQLKHEDDLIGVVEEFGDDFKGDERLGFPRLGLGAPGLVNRAARARLKMASKRPSAPTE